MHRGPAVLYFLLMNDGVCADSSGGSPVPKRRKGPSTSEPNVGCLACFRRLLQAERGNVPAGEGPGHPVTEQAVLPRERSEHSPCSTKPAPLSCSFFHSFFTPFSLLASYHGNNGDGERKIARIESKKNPKERASAPCGELVCV